MKNPKMRELKQWLKTTAVVIRRLKYQHKENQRNSKNDKSGGKEYVYLKELQWEYRNRHIAYSELLGRTREQIEPTLRDDTRRPDEKWIAKIKQEVIDAIVKEVA